MLRRASIVLAVIAVAGCDARGSYQQPPSNSYTTRSAHLTIGDAASTVQAADVTRDFFELSGALPLLGRFFVKGDADSPAAVVVLSYALWSERMGSSPAVIGSKIDLDGQPHIVIGIAPRDFRLPDQALLWTLRPGPSR